MSNCLLKCVVVASGMLLASGTASAAILAEYVLVDQTIVPSPFASLDADSSSTASALTVGGGIGFQNSGQSGLGSGSRSLYLESSQVTTSEAAAFTANDYATFTITPSPGNAINPTSITLALGARRTSTVGDFTAFGFVRSSATGDAFGTTVGSTVSHTVSQTGAQTIGTTFTNGLTISLASLADITTETTFRVYLYRSSSPSERIYFDNIRLNGDVIAVPEPATLSMVGVAGAMLLARRRNGR